MLYNKKIFITGGAGFLGKYLVDKYHRNNSITVYSRDEAKHYYMKRQYPDVNFVVGDVRNYDLMQRVSRNHDIGIFAASMKQIDACTYNAEEANQTIVQGALNSRRIAEENEFESACFISSDKSRSATTIYGAMKFIAGESFIIKNRPYYQRQEYNVKLSTAIYGNVANSTGSIIPVLWKCIDEGIPATLFHSGMTRFYIELEEASNLVENALEYDGVNVIPRLRSYRMIDLFELYQEEFGLNFEIGAGVRAGEKIHEIMFNEEEANRVQLINSPTGDFFILPPEYTLLSNSTITNEYSSKNELMTKSELKTILENRGYFR
jgi:UDP-glucose 4-epimerase